MSFLRRFRRAMQEMQSLWKAYLLHQQSLQLSLQGQYDQALITAQEAVEIRRSILGENHSSFAVSLNNLADIYRLIGDYARAEPLYIQAMEIVRMNLGEADPDFATILNNLALLYYSIGDYVRAESLHRHALEIRRDSLGEVHQDYAVSLNNLAILYQSMGDYTQAEPLYRQALDIFRTTLGEDNADFATGLNNLASLYRIMGDYAQAEPLYRQAMEIRHSTLGDDHPNFADSLNNLAVLYQLIGDYDRSEPLYRQAVEIGQTALGKDHPSVATDVNNLAMLYLSMGDYARAEPLCRQALEINQTALGEVHPGYGLSLRNLAVLCAATEREEEALALMARAAVIDDRMIGEIFSIGSEQQRMAYLNSIQKSTKSFYSLISQYLEDKPQAIHAGMNLALRRKALGAEGLAVQRDAVLSGRYPELEPELRQFTVLRRQIAQKTLAGPGPEGLESHQQLLAEWGSRQRELEAELARHIPEMNLSQKLQDVDCQTIAQVLPEASVLVEFVRFDVFDFQAIPANGDPKWLPARYLAFVLPTGQPDALQMIDLGEAEVIDRLIADFRMTVTGEVMARARSSEEADSSPSDAEVTVHSDPVALRSAIGLPTRALRPPGWKSMPEFRFEQGTRLRQALFNPLLQAIGERKRLFLAPDGNLSRLPFEILPLDKDRFMIDEYEISYLSVGRDLQRFGVAPGIESNEPLVFADPNFDMAGDTVQGFKAGDPFGELSGTRGEGEQVAALLGVKARMVDDGVEQVVKDCRSPRILHIASHGFFLESLTAKKETPAPFTEVPGSVNLLGSIAEVQNPLLRSSLVMAGANTYLQGGSLPPEAEDGLLTAEDVTGMDLLGTEMVVLSACDTGRGEEKVGEGVFGLRRAFVLAGAKALVMSLWKVPDEETRMLMEEFYRLVLDGQPRVEALREAQLMMKQRLLDAGEDPDPYFWGAFICQGDPYPLMDYDYVKADIIS